MKKQKSVATTINAALKSGDATRPIIGRDAHAPKTGNGTAAKKTLTALVKEAQEAAKDANNAAGDAKESEDYACDHKDAALDCLVNSRQAARTAKWCAAIAAASAIISIIAAAI